MNTGDRSRLKLWLLLGLYLVTASLLWTYTVPVLGITPNILSCQEQDLDKLINQLLQDLPSYANRVSQRARRLNRTVDIYSYVLLAGRPEFAPLTLGPGVYQPAEPQLGDQQPQQVFFTTLERQYIDGKPVELQQYHWLFLTKTDSGWRLAIMFSRTGSYPEGKPPTPPRESSDGVIAQAISTWLRDYCRTPSS